MKIWWSKISLVFLFLVALIGTLLRSATYISIPLEYVNLVHAHSHVAFQGWVYTILFLLLTCIFIKKQQLKKGRYALQFILTIFIVVGVLISFSLQGYALYSIIFSTLFQLLNYWFIYRFLKDTKGDNNLSLRFVKTGLWYGLLSTLMPFGIGILSAKGLQGSEPYQSLVYTFLHLQYNGWFLFVVLGLFFHYFEKNAILINRKHLLRCYWLLTISVIPAISLSLLGMEFSKSIIPLAYISALLLTAGLVFFLLVLPRNLMLHLKQKSKWFTLYFMVFVLSFSLKMVLQILSVLPFFNYYAFHNKNIIIAYLHLSLIGSISFLLLAMMLEMKWLSTNKLVKIGSILLVLGYIITELLLLLSGLGFYFNTILLILGSLAMALGVLFMLFSKSNITTENHSVH